MLYVQVWLQQRRTGREQWRQGVEGIAAALAGLAGPPAALIAAMKEEEDDEEGYGDPPEAKSLLEELGERQSECGSVAALVSVCVCLGLK